MELSHQDCSPLKKNQGPLSLQIIRNLESEIPQWSQHSGTLEREFVFANFSQAMLFVNQVAQLAEMQNHHPDFNIVYNKVRLMLTTHEVNGLSNNDFILAAKIDQLHWAHPWRA